MAAPFTIREASDRDVPALEEVRAATWVSTYGAFISREDILDETFGWGARWYQQFRPEIGEFALIAEQAGKAIGMLVGGPTRDGFTEFPGEIHVLYVLESHQGQGVGRALVCAAYDRLAAWGLAPVYVFAMKENAKARAFYEVSGAMPIGVEKPFYLGRTKLTDYGYGWRRRPFSSTSEV